MDTQAWLVLGVSLVGGAGGASIVNTIFAIKKQKQDRVDEHAWWLRDRKLEAYSGFLTASFSAFEKVPFMNPKDPSEYLEALQSVSLTERSRVDLLASAEVSDAAEVAYLNLHQLIRAMTMNNSEDPDNEKHLDMRSVIDALSAFTKTARKDLDTTLE